MSRTVQRPIPILCSAERLEPRVLLAIVPAGESFRIDPGGGAPHGTPEVSADADGDSVVVWAAEREFGEIEVFGRRYSAAGAPVGPAFQVNQTPTGVNASTPDAESRVLPDVALDADGDFVVVWDKARPATGGGGSDVYARRFAADGSAAGDEFRVNSASFARFGESTAPSVSAAPGGDFVVVWTGGVEARDPRNVYARPYDAAGAPKRDELMVNMDKVLVDAPQGDPDVAVGADGRFVVAWSGIGYSFDDADVFGRRFAPSGTPLGDEFVVTGGGASERSATVTIDAAGGFVIAYFQGGVSQPPETLSHVAAARYWHDGTLLERLRVSEDRADRAAPSAPRIDGTPDGRFAVTWAEGSADANARVMARWYASGGFPVAPPVEVAEAGTALKLQPGIAVDDEGDTVIVWRGSLASPGVFGRRYVEDRRPTVSSLTDEPDPLLAGRTLFLTAHGVSAPGGTVSSVSMYRESNGIPGYQAAGTGGAGPDVFLGTAFPISPASYLLSVETRGLAAGTYTYYAVARNAAGAASDAASTTNTVFEGPPGPPAVAAVYVNGTQWSDSFRRKLRDAGLGSAELGFAVPAGAGQLAPIPFVGIDLISVRFTEDVVVSSAMLTVRSANGSRYSVGSIFVYDEQTFTATWLTGVSTADRIRLELPSGPDGVHDYSGDALDGEWADGADAYPSGDGAPGGDFNFGLNVLVGDADRNGRVDVRDWMEVRRRQDNPDFPNPARYSVFADVDGSGQVNSRDLLLVRRQLGISLPKSLLA